MERQYIGARYVPKFYEGSNGNQWDSGVAYEALTIVTYLNNSYTSKIPVPATTVTPNNDSTHWVLTGAYNAQVEQYRQDTDRLENELLEAIESSPIGSNSKLLIVGNGGQYSTINSAIVDALPRATANNRVTIFILSGIYNEEIRTNGANIDFVGANRDSVIVETTSAYPNAPIFISGNCSVSNMTFRNNATDSYALHIEGQDTRYVSGKIDFFNCTFESTGKSCVGIGCGLNTTINFRECYMHGLTGSTWCVYLHNLPQGGSNQNVSFIRNTFIGDKASNIYIENSRKVHLPSAPVSNMTISFEGSTSNGTVTFRNSDAETLSYVPVGDDIVLSYTSLPNGINGLDINKRFINTRGDCVVSPTGVFSYQPQGVLPRQYNWKLITATTSNGTNIAGSVAIFDTSDALVLTTTNDTAKTEKFISVMLQGLPK